MFRTIVLSSAGAGFSVGLLMAILQHFTSTPLILAAEIFEAGGHDHHEIIIQSKPAHGHSVQESISKTTTSWLSTYGPERLFHTSLTTMLIGVAGALVILSSMVFIGMPIDGRSGLSWGIAAFATIALAPAFGLAPNLPGSANAELLVRQLWWLATVLATAVGIFLLAFRKSGRSYVIATLIIAAPHLFGAPKPAEFTSLAPAELTAQFAIVSLGLLAIFWLLLGWCAGCLFKHLSPRRTGVA
jgi:cobalt transporter subunit CbtA